MRFSDERHEGDSCPVSTGRCTRAERWCYLSNGVPKSLLAAYAKAVGAGPDERLVLPLDNADAHARPSLAVPDSIRLVEQLPDSPELQRAEALRPLAAEPIVDKLVRPLDAPVDTIGAPCRDLCELRWRTNVSWSPRN